jgi:hypothetical protein
MSAKGSISSGEKLHLYYQELLSEDPKSVVLELENLVEYRIEKETCKRVSTDVLTFEMLSWILSIDWIKKRSLQGAVGGPVGAELGSPDCPWE